VSSALYRQRCAARAGPALTAATSAAVLNKPTMILMRDMTLLGGRAV